MMVDSGCGESLMESLLIRPRISADEMHGGVFIGLMTTT